MCIHFIICTASYIHHLSLPQLIFSRPYSRKLEAEADQVGLQLAAKVSSSSPLCYSLKEHFTNHTHEVQFIVTMSTTSKVKKKGLQPVFWPVEITRLKIFNRKPALQTGSMGFEKSGSLMKDAVELHYKKCRIQHFLEFDPYNRLNRVISIVTLKIIPV